jgi:hypothetical protein
LGKIFKVGLVLTFYHVRRRVRGAARLLRRRVQPTALQAVMLPVVSVAATSGRRRFYNRPAAPATS